jgi:hypothetical protein
MAKNKALTGVEATLATIAQRKNKTLTGVEATLAQRKNQHGDFSDFAEQDRQFKELLKNSRNYEVLSDVQKTALDMITHKITRILVGNPNHKDHWHDIGGYAKLAEDRCED